MEFYENFNNLKSQFIEFFLNKNILYFQFSLSRVKISLKSIFVLLLQKVEKPEFKINIFAEKRTEYVHQLFSFVC